MKNLRYICVQPAIEYYTWQVEVLINNFIKHGVNPNHMDIVCSYKGTVPDVWRKMQATYNTVRFFFYEDTRENPKYISSIRPHILKKHFEAHPYLKDEAIFYHDSDIVFTQAVDFSHLLNDDIWYLSDTNSYINATYVKSKKYGVYERMCEIIGISQEIPENYDQHSGGAQYLMKNIDAAFWEKVESDCEKLYDFFLVHLKAFPEGCLKGYHPIQKWTADMWAVLWNAWYFGHDTQVIKELDFCWPGYKLDDWNNFKIFHNAGVTGDINDKERLFYKGLYINKLPYDININDYNAEKCTTKYVEEILETVKKSCLL
jgi:hypothetical protein